MSQTFPKIKSQPHPRFFEFAFLLLLTLACVTGSSGMKSPTPDIPPGGTGTSQSATTTKDPHGETITLSRPIRTWEFLDAAGTRAGLFGHEDGRFEAWIYPLKIFRDFHLIFHSNGSAIPAESLARTLIVNPEGPTIVYAGDAFEVRETWIAPPGEMGAIIRLDINSFAPLQIEAAFQRDFQLMWPAAIGGTYMGWDDSRHAFTFGEEQKKYFAVAGSPAAVDHSQELFTNNVEQGTSSIRLASVGAGRSTQIFVVVGSFTSREQAAETYQRLTTEYDSIQQSAARFYRAYLDRTVQLRLPDERLQHAYDWSRISLYQGLVENPFLGTGLVAGYRGSGSGARPGFAWMFGRDALWSSLALDAEGDFSTVRTALEFLSKFQRADGKVEHEISQSASLVPWFTNYPYGYASADATPLYIIAADDYVSSSGDVQFARAHWDNILRAYQFLKSTYMGDKLPRNLGIGHGWIEGGPLLPVKTEQYQSGLGLQALRSMARLAGAAGKRDLQKTMTEEFARQQPIVDQAFWSEKDHSYIFALGVNGEQVAVPTVLSTVPMWFDLLNEKRASSTISTLADWDHSADWGMRIISSQNPLYDPTGYHFGSVWPLFTGWAAVGEYREHRALPAYANLRANALLALDGPLGRVTEVLSGTYYSQLATSSPHQVWSSAMVISPMLLGMLGLDHSGHGGRLGFAPHVPAGWKHFEVANLPACGGKVALDYSQSWESDSAIDLRVSRDGSSPCEVEFAPAISPRAEIVGVEVDGGPAKFIATLHGADQHVGVKFSPAGKSTLKIRLRNNFALRVGANLPPLGSTSQNLKIVSETWNTAHDRLTLRVSGTAGKTYDVQTFGSAIASIGGGTLEGGTIHLTFPAGAEGSYLSREVVVAF